VAQFRPRMALRRRASRPNGSTGPVQPVEALEARKPKTTDVNDTCGAVLRRHLMKTNQEGQKGR